MSRRAHRRTPAHVEFRPVGSEEKRDALNFVKFFLAYTAILFLVVLALSVNQIPERAADVAATKEPMGGRR